MNDNKADKKRYKVVVTGFGPFREHTTNTSWEAIRDGRLQTDLPHIELLTEQLPVSYEYVQHAIENMWKVHEPILMVHVGLAAFEDHIRLERRGRQGPYLNEDIEKHIIHERPKDHASATALECEPGFCHIETCFKVAQICDKLNKFHKEGQLPIPFKESHDAGLYVCEYLYHRSLTMNRNSIFIHVPEHGERFTLDKITECLKRAIELLIEERLNSD